MRDPFKPNSNSQLFREAQIGLSLIAVLFVLFVYVAYIRITGFGRSVPDYVRQAPVAESVWPHEFAASDPTNRKPQSKLTVDTEIELTSVLQSSFEEPIYEPTTPPARPLVAKRLFNPVPSERETDRGSQFPFAATPQNLEPAAKQEGQQARRNEQKVEQEFSSKELSNKASDDQLAAKGKSSNRDDPFDMQRQPTNRLLPANSLLAENRDSPAAMEYPQADTSPKIRPGVSPASSEPQADQTSRIDQAEPLLASNNVTDFSPVIPNVNNSIFKSTDSKDNGNDFQTSAQTIELYPPARSKSFQAESNSIPDRTDKTLSKVDNSFQINDLRDNHSVPNSKTTSGDFDVSSVTIRDDRFSFDLRETEPASSTDSTQSSTSVIDVADDVSPSMVPPTPGRFSSPAKTPKNLAADVEAAFHIVVEGESLWTIAQTRYDDGRYFRALYQYNEDQLANIDRLIPGTRIDTPSPAELARMWPELCPETEPVNGDQHSVTSSNVQYYITQSGDTLFEIARQRLGQASRYLDILELNTLRLPADVSHLSPLKAGINLVLPNSAD